MNWYWRVRIYNYEGHYWHAQVVTRRELRQIDDIQDFYANLTGCKMLIEGMGETKFEGVALPQEAFKGLWLNAA